MAPSNTQPNQEVDKLCSELSARRKGDAPATKSSSQAARRSNAARASDDFWGGGGGGGGGASRGRTGVAPATKSSGRSGGASSVAAAGNGRRGQQAGKTSPPAAASVAGKGMGKGKLYQKAAAEEDFWGGGTTSGRSKTTTQRPSSSSSSAKSGSSTPPARAAVAPAQAVATNARPGGAPGGNTKGSSVDGKLSVSAVNTTTTKKALKQPPAAAPATAPASKPASGGKHKAAAPPPTAGAKKTTATAVAAAVATPAPAPEWSGVTCLCMGKTHDVVTNCTSCGKIACVKEGGFGCSFCGSALPLTGREPRKIDGTTDGVGGATGAEKNNPAASPQSAALKEALERKDRLLLFDRTSASRTRVLDDQGDYFTSHNWLSQGEREKGEAEEKARRDDAASQRGARRQVKMSIDIMGRRVIETQDTAAADTAAAARGVGEESTTRSGGVSLDFGLATSGGRGGDSSTAAVDKDDAIEVETPGPGTAGGANQRVSLENTGLRGRAKEVYDVMRANLDKKNRRRPGAGKAAAGLQRKSGSVAESSRVSLWRVQHDVDSDDLLRQSPPSGGGAVGGVGDGFEKFEPADEAACAR